jgi:hypothetical protein
MIMLYFSFTMAQTFQSFDSYNFCDSSSKILNNVAFIDNPKLA